MPSDRHLLALSFAAGEDSLSVRRFCINEGLSKLYTVDLIAVSPDPDIDLETIVGKPASFRLMTDNPTAPERLWSGICNHFELVHGVLPAPGVATSERSTYHLRIVPTLWLATQRRERRIYQQLTLPVIVQRVLDEWKIAAKWELKKEVVDAQTAEGPGDVYRKHDYVVQYGESDFDFICRLLERAGITFHFRFEGSSETQLVLTDLPHEGAPRSDLPIDCFDTPPLSPPAEYLTHLRLGHSVQPGSVTLQDYDFRRSYDYELRATARDEAREPEDFCEQYRYTPGLSLVDVKRGGAPATPQADDRGIFARHHDPELAAQAARDLQSLRKHKRWIRYETNCPDLAPGVLFSVTRHPRTEITTGKQPRFLVSEASLEGTATGDWVFSGKAAFTDLPWVPDQRTPTPRIHGMQSALVVGAPGEEIHADELGRVRVQFHWDREGQYDEKSSCWVRVSQDWAGAGFGAILLPRVGQEVLVGFYEGNPEQPVIVGRVYNEVSRVPYKLPDHETRSTWKTDSTPLSDGFNEIMLEDRADRELFYLQAERDLQKLVKQYETTRTGHDRIDIVGHDRSTVVGELDARMVAERYLVQMMPPADDRKLAIQKQEEARFAPRPTAVEMTDERIIFTTGKATIAFDGQDIRLEAQKDITIVAAKGDVVLEGSHAYFNTLTPGPAPKIGAFEALTPGTYSSQAADAAAALQQKLKRDQTDVDVAAPDAPAWDGSGPEVEEYDCHLVKTQLFCQHDKAPRVPDPDSGVLEVTAPTLSDTITLRAQHAGACREGGKHPEWKISGPDGTEYKHGSEVTFDAKLWKLKNRAYWPARTTPKTYAVFVRACTGPSKAYQVKVFPNDKWKLSFDFKKPEPWTEGWIGRLRDALAGFLSRCGAKNSKGMLKEGETHTGFEESGAKAGEVMSDAKVDLEFLKGRLRAEGQWAEWPDDHRCFWKWQLTADFFPLIGIRAKIAITPKVPWPLSWLADGYLYVELWGRIETNVGVQRKTPETTWQIKPKVEAYGGLRVRLGAHLHLISKKALAVEGWGQTDVGIKAAYDTSRGPVDPPAAKFSLVWKGFSVGVWVVLCLDFWKLGKIKKELREEWLLLEGAEKSLGVWEFWPKDSAAEDRI